MKFLDVHTHLNLANTEGKRIDRRMYKGPTAYVSQINAAVPFLCYAMQLANFGGLSKALAYPNTSLIRKSKVFWNFGLHLFLRCLKPPLCRTGFNDHLKGRPVVFCRASEIKWCGSIGRKVHTIRAGLARVGADVFFFLKEMGVHHAVL